MAPKITSNAYKDADAIAFYESFKSKPKRSRVGTFALSGEALNHQN